MVPGFDPWERASPSTLSVNDCNRQKENTMAATKKKAGGNVKNKKKYQALKRKGMSKTRAAKIANSGKAGSRKGGRNSHKKD
jgi:hypothetical protein